MFVGRVGALAVALGIGSAVFGAPAQAWATDTASSDTSTGNGSDHDTSSPSGPTASDPGERDKQENAQSTGDGDQAAGGDSRKSESDPSDTGGGAAESDPDDGQTPGKPKRLPTPHPVRSGADTDLAVPAGDVIVGGTPLAKAGKTADVPLAAGGDAPDSLADSSEPPAPLKGVAEVALLAVARRGSAAAEEGDPDQKVTPPAAVAVNSLTLEPNSPPLDAGSAPAATVTVQIPTTPTPGYEKPADWESAYTGAPSFLHQVVVTGLLVVQAVAKFLGISFNLDSGSSPIAYFNDGKPPRFLMFGTDVTKEQYVDVATGAVWDEWIITPKAPTAKRVIALHGGGFFTEASAFNFLTYRALATSTGATVVVPVYPVISKGGTAATVVPVTANLISAEVLGHGADNVSVLGDSAGGNLGLAALELLAARIRTGQAAADSMPGRLVLLSPGLDSNDPIADIPFPDPYLDAAVIRAARAAWMQGLELTDPLGSPIYGSLAGLPPTTVYSSSMDSMTFQTLRLQQKAIAEHATNFTFVLRKGLLHDWAVWFFLPDAHADWPGIYADLGLMSAAADAG